ncbi:MAG: hypothetical protein HY832_03220 [Candidatus Aenigmarchaeota archaeon]|nr:hypothetical protein [Candidatus Aenigmarchaeota archaeon]
MNKSYLFLIAFVVLIAGCTTTEPAKIDANNGITISGFVVTPSETREGNLVLFDTEFQNTGGTTAKNVEVALLRVEEIWRDSFGHPVLGTPKQTVTTMKPPIPELNRAGTRSQKQWEFMTPSLPQGITTSFVVTNRISYDYNTSGYIAFTAMTEDEIQRREMHNEPQKIAPDVVNSAGPLHITVPEQGRQTLIIDNQDLSEQYESRSLSIQIENVGDGFPITPEPGVAGGVLGAGGKLSGTIDLFGAGAEFENCLGVTSGKTIRLDDAQITTRIRENGKVPIACGIKIDKRKWGNTAVGSVNLAFNIFYRYYVESEASIKVIGK